MRRHPLVDPADLAVRIAGRRHRPVLLDVRWTLAGSDPDGYAVAHIPGARYVDLDTSLAAPAGVRGRHPLPSAEDLAQTWHDLCVGTETSVVVYDGGPGLAAARAWWLLRWSGVRDAAVLDGGLPAWRADPSRPIESGWPAHPPVVTGTAMHFGAMPVVEIDDVATVADDGVLLDARAAPRYRGEFEPLDPVAGHVPGAVNLPATELLRADGRYRPADELADLLRDAGVVADRRAAASCGSGVTACQLVLAGEIVGTEIALFPGSYSQWCAAGRPVAVGG